MSVLEASLCAIACMGSHARVGLNEAAVLVENRRMQLVSTAFPYLFGDDGEDVPVARTETMDELFDELDEIVKREGAGKSDGDSPKGKSVETASVEPTEGKLV